MGRGWTSRRLSSKVARSLRALIALTTAVAFITGSAPYRLARASGPEQVEAAETPNFSDDRSGVRAGADDAASAAKKTKARKAPVSASGAFAHSVDIQVPPGRLGMTPALALSYNSSSIAESPVGVGWSFGVPAISRSTRLGFPKIKLAPHEYDDDAATFTGPAGEMVLAIDGPDGLVNLYAPARETTPVRFEYRKTEDRWVEHDPSGIKRYYGRHPSDAPQIPGLDPNDPARLGLVRNELGTHSWLLVREEDRNGNAITYSYHNAAEATRTDRFKAQRMPVLSRVEWGGNRITGLASPFYVQTTLGAQTLPDAQMPSSCAGIGQAGPVNLLNGNTRLDDRITKIDVGMSGAVQWTYTLSHVASETCKTLLASVARGGDSAETISFTYSLGAPASGARFVEQTQQPLPALFYENNSRKIPLGAIDGIDPRLFWHAPERHEAESAVQAPAFRSGVKFIDVDGNGTTDAIYHASGIGTTQTHVLWEDSVLQTPAASGMGAWNTAALGDPSTASNQPTTGLPYFPFNAAPFTGLWNRPDFATAALHDLVDLDGDGDADAIALPFTLEFANGVGVLDSAPRVRHALPQGPSGTMNLRVFTNSARGGSVQLQANQQLADWPIDHTWSFQTAHLYSMVLSSSGKDPGTSALRYKVEPINDLQLPLVDLNADGKVDMVLTKRRHQHANYVPPGAPTGAIAGVGAYAVPIQTLLRFYGSLAGHPEAQPDGPAVGGAPFEARVRHDVEGGLIVLVDEALLKRSEEPTLYSRIVTTAEALRIPEVPPATTMVLMSAPGGLPMPGDPGTPPIPTDEIPPFEPENPFATEWWHSLQPQIDRDVYIPLRDAYDVGAGFFGFRMFYGNYRYVPRVYLTRGATLRWFESERTENSSEFEAALRGRLNPGWEDECNALDCLYPPHVNFNTFFMDLNGDGLADLVTARRPFPWIVGGTTGIVCDDGHDVYLNRGYTFEAAETETLTHQWNPANGPFATIANRDRYCSNERPKFSDRTAVFVGTPLPTYPTSAVAHADIDGDGRVDVVLAHQQVWTNDRNQQPLQSVYRNTGRGFKSGVLTIPAGVAISRNLKFWPTYLGAPWQQASNPAVEWPRVGAPDRARFVDLDNDGLVDIVVAGDCIRLTAADALDCVPARWYRNMGEIPDRLTKVTSTTGAWTEVTYDSPKSTIVQLPADGLRPAASMRLVKTIKSAAGPVPTPAGYDPFPVEEIRLSYENYVKDLVDNEGLGFEKVTAEFINEFNGTPRETVRVTQTFDVRPEIAGITLRHPLRGALVSTVTESAGWTASDIQEYLVEEIGNGVRIRPRRELHGDTSPSTASAWNARETVEFDAYGFATRSVTGDWNGAAIVGKPRTTVMNYEHRTSPWQIGLVSRKSLFGYSEDIAGIPNTAQVLSEVTTSYDPLGRIQSAARRNIRGGTCAGPDDDLTTFEYFPHGLVQAVHELAVHDPDTGSTYTRDVTTTYQPLDLYPATASVRAGKLVGGAFTPAQTTLTTTFLTDHRTGQNTNTKPPSGAATVSTYDSRGRLATRLYNYAGTNYQLVQVARSNAFPVWSQETVNVDATLSYVERTQVDADGNVLSVVRQKSGVSQWSRTVKNRYDAFGRVVESYHPKFVGAINGGYAPDPTGPKDVARYDGLDRLVQATDAAGSTRSFSYEPRETFETNPRGFVTKRTFDEFGDIVTLTRNPGGASSERSVHSFVRDGRGEILQVVDDDGSVRRFERDGGGRLLHVTLPTAPGATPAQFSMCHDVDDKLVALQSPNGRSIEVVHDELGRTLATRGEDANGLYVETTQTYDDALVANGLGRPRSRTDESGQYTYQWDQFGHPLSQTYAPSTRARAGATNVAASYGASFVYTRSGNLKTVNFSGLTKAAGITYTLDGFGRPVLVTSSNAGITSTVAADILYDAAGRVTSARYGNNHTASWTFNPVSERLDGIAYRNASNVLYTAVSYGYDANSNIVREDRERAGVSGIWRQKLHDFDALDRLKVTSSQTSSGTTAQSFTYTSSGNLTQAGYEAYSYDAAVSSQATSRVENSATGSQRTLGYDDDGYLANDGTTNADGTRTERTFAFDPMGCIRSIARVDRGPSGEVTSTASSDYTCGPGGQVVARATTLPTGAKSRRIDFAGLVEIRADDGVFLIRIPVGGTVAYEDARVLNTGDTVSALSTYLVSDIRGSVIATSSWSSSPSAPSREAEFEAWGEKLTNYTSLSSPRHGFDGAEADAAVGTYSFGARTYDPSLRRWVSPDPLLAAAPALDDTIGDNLNLYAFSGNNPVLRIDLTGFEGENAGEKTFAERLRQAAVAAKNAAAAGAAIASRPISIGGGYTFTYSTYVQTIGNEEINANGPATVAKLAGAKVPTFDVKSSPGDVSVKAGKIAHVLGGAALSAPGIAKALTGGGVKPPSGGGGGGGGGGFDSAAAKRALFLQHEKAIGNPAARSAEALARFRQGTLRIPEGLTKAHLEAYRAQAVTVIDRAAKIGASQEAIARAAQEPRITLIDEIIKAGVVK